VLVKTNESEYYSLASNLVFNKMCEVSLDKILFIERINKIKETKSVLYLKSFSIDSWLIVSDQIEFKPDNLISGQRK
jgi:hypothetical protein